MSEKIALDCIADAVDLQTEVLSCLILRVQILEAQIQQMQQTTGRMVLLVRCKCPRPGSSSP